MLFWTDKAIPLESLRPVLSQSEVRNTLLMVDWTAHPSAKSSLKSLKSAFLPEDPMPKAAQPDLTDALAADVPATYEVALLELETLVGQLESGQMPLDQLLTGYQRGAVLLAFCRDKLKAVEDQIQVLDGGQLKPWSSA
jgi:exodeoxyribonuclease VII small subunit